MVAMDSNDPESVARASAIIRQHADMLGASVRNAIYISWLRLKDFDAVESKYRTFLDSALHDFHADQDEYMLSIDMGRATPSEQPIGDSAKDDVSEEQQIRVGVYVFWIGLAPERRNHETLEAEIRKIMGGQRRSPGSDSGFGIESEKLFDASNSLRNSL
ncbi:hypothetical protein [Stieleria varia]|uniref:Uncharacterized protein n=1 Tax=Stieleria varia TaxID=2528005 RepID=A0A5C6AY33_9BACT|nr:hypothetical protein [Stieleria varia]TWU04843.1 hypothetical protein Pla52n_28880 [Stieleria varia]